MSITVLHPGHADSATPSAKPSWVRRVWAALEAQGQRRAAIDLRAIAGRYATSDPELSRVYRAMLSSTRV